VRIVPAEIPISPGRERRVQAIAVDRDGRRLCGEIALVWSTDNEALAIVGEGAKPLVRAQADPQARPAGHDHRCGHPGRGARRSDDPGARWRSRFDGQRWQVNASHEDYIALRGEPRTRLRYLLARFAKEVALRAHGVPGSEEALESVVEILAHAERNLASV
jgi:hypothetical protein